MTELVFLGTDVCIPSPGNDTASYLLNGDILVDTGWHVSESLRRCGHTPADIRHVFLTHLHHDHVMGLPALLYERITAGTVDELIIYGPKGIEDFVKKTYKLLDVERYWPDRQLPHIVTLYGEDNISIDNVSVTTMKSIHAVSGLCYRFSDQLTCKSVGITGDGIPQVEFKHFFKDCDVLIHEYSWGLWNGEEHKKLHSSARDAACTASEARVKVLCPVHGPLEQKAKCDVEIRNIYKGNLFWPTSGDRLVLCEG